MAEKILNTRIQLKYDTYDNWTKNNPTLKAGEVAIGTIPTSAEGVQGTPPIVVVKVGDGTSTYTALPFISGKAQDVYAWAKTAEKPTYTAEEISGLEAYISGKVEDTDTQYNLVQKNSDNKHEITLQKQAKGTSAWTDVVTITVPDDSYNDTAVKADIEKLKGLVGDTQVATQIANAIQGLETVYEKVGVAATEAGKVQTALNSYKESNDAVIAAIKDGTSIDSFKDVETALAGKQATGDYATKTEAQGYADAKDAAIAEAKQAADDAQADVDALEKQVGPVPAASTIVGMIDEVKYNHTDLQATVNANEGKINTLNGTGAGSVKDTANKEAQAVLDAWLKLTPDGDQIDRWTEVIQYISTHETAAQKMLQDILEAQEDIETLEGLVGSTAVTTQIANAIDAALKVGGSDKYALASALESAIERISANETAIADKVDEDDLATIAKTGNVNDLIQTSGDVLVFDCGNSGNFT